MNYLSTRGDNTSRKFCDILLEGLAPDGGLYLPEHYPQVTPAMLDAWRSLPYADLAFEILSLYIDDIPAEDLRAICRKTYTQDVFGTAEIVPLKRMQEPSPQPSPANRSGGKTSLYLQALSNGPTLAFKDMAMQLLGNLFEYELARRGEQLNILGATSGDTGSAAEYAMRGKQGVRVFMTSPAGRMSAFQQAQMFSLMDANIHNIAITGVFDDCQDIVKAVSNDLVFKRLYKIGTVNSINWARLLAQVVYYFSGYLQAPTLVASRTALPPEGAALLPAGPQTVSFTVPSGNFGNVCAGHVARMMGLPIAAVPTPTRRPARRWIFPKPATLNALCLTCWAATGRVQRNCLARNSASRVSSTCLPIRSSPKPPAATALPVAAAPMPTGCTPFAARGSSTASWSTRTPPTA
jgi:threonine synthase